MDCTVHSLCYSWGHYCSLATTYLQRLYFTLHIWRPSPETYRLFISRSGTIAAVEAVIADRFSAERGHLRTASITPFMHYLCLPKASIDISFIHQQLRGLAAGNFFTNRLTSDRFQNMERHLCTSPIFSRLACITQRWWNRYIPRLEGPTIKQEPGCSWSILWE